MEWTTRLWRCYISTDPCLVSTNQYRTEPKYIKYPATRWCVCSAYFYVVTYTITGQAPYTSRALTVVLLEETILLKGWHSFRIMCVANVANVVVLLVSRGVRSLLLTSNLIAPVLGCISEFSTTTSALNVFNPFCQNSLRGVTSGLTNVLVSTIRSIWWLRCKMDFNQDFSNTNIKAHVESPWPEGNGSNWIVGVSIISCKHGICRETY